MRRTDRVPTRVFIRELPRAQWHHKQHRCNQARLPVVTVSGDRNISNIFPTKHLHRISSLSANSYRVACGMGV